MATSWQDPHTTAFRESAYVCLDGFRTNEGESSPTTAQRMINQNPAHYEKRKKYPRVLSFSGRSPKTHNSRECLRATLNKLVTHRSKTLYFMSHLLSWPILLSSSSCYTHPDEPSHLFPFFLCESQESQIIPDSIWFLIFRKVAGTFLV